ncbi:MAG: metallophosphoesterase [Betaproteobacteria bacterium]|nr:metallophosphoesterase [Betaproteobacteria bacterium]
MRDWIAKAAAIGALGLCMAQPVVAGHLAAYVVLGPEGKAIVRVLAEPGQSCPSLEIEHQPVPMTPRAEPAASPSGGSHPSTFPVLVCELALPHSVRQVLLEGKSLPLPVRPARRIVVLGDSGCRMKWPASFQDCSDPARWPFSRIARSAAADRPDLVIHVGDYHYRESRCLAGGCSGSPYGYGWDAWKTDFFEPASPLLQAAPWVMARGNHESCKRAGQGWFRFLDAHRYDAAHACDGGPPYAEDFSQPFAVPLGEGHQLIVFDSAAASGSVEAVRESATRVYASQWAEVARLAAQQPFNWLVLHHPLLGYGYQPLAGYFTDSGTAGAALLDLHFPDLLPSNIQLVLQGHIHTFEISRFQGNLPVSLLAGFAGSTLESGFPEGFPQSLAALPGVRLAQSWHSQVFGYVLLEQQEKGWVLYEKNPDGDILRQCTLALGKPPYALSCKP